jgi:hypothetical protein
MKLNVDFAALEAAVRLMTVGAPAAKTNKEARGENQLARPASATDQSMVRAQDLSSESPDYGQGA